MDEASDDEWESMSDENRSYHVKQNRKNHDDPWPSWSSESAWTAASSERHDVGALVPTTQPTGTGDDSSAEWLSTSDDSCHIHRKNDDYPDENRPSSTPVGTDVWTVTPKAWFFRDEPKNGSSTNLCNQCSQIDFKAIFCLDPQMIANDGNRTCSFSGLSRSMLTSGCPACRVFATTVYTKYKESDELALNLSKDTFEGHLVALSSGELCGFDFLASDFLTNQSVILKMELLMSPLPFQARPWDSFHYLRPFGRTPPFWEYVRARGVILPAAMIESAYIDFKALADVKGFCYGIPLEERVNIHRISTMLHRCQQLHPACRTNNGLSFPQKARVIDCETRRVVSMVDGQTYIALSYVWGAPNNADGSTRSDTSEPSDCLPPVLPQTIEDALKITLCLGYRFLWIDSLCIDQCHSTDKAFQIQQMGNIYTHAAATICALKAHPHLGLPGVSRIRPVSESFRSQDVTYIRVPEPDSLRRVVRDSAWLSRGWTFQEAILSHRCLFFTDEQVSLVCHASHQAETISQLANELWGSNTNIFTAILGDETSEDDLSFEVFVNHYQRRHLSYESDTLDAFKGLLSLAPTQSYFGILLPRSFKKKTNASTAFAYGLLWQMDNIEEHSQGLRASFPSWSWVSRECIGIDFRFVGERILDEELQYKQLLKRALCMWMECSERTWVARIYANTLDSDPILIEDLFRKYDHMKVIPEESKMLRLESFTVTYQILKTHPPEMGGRRDYADVAMETSKNLPFEFPNPDDAQRDYWWESETCYTKYLYDNMLSINDPGTHSRLAILLVDSGKDTLSQNSYWLALRPAYDENERCCFYREGIITMRGRLKWKENWESTPRDEIWLM